MNTENLTPLEALQALEEGKKVTTAKRGGFIRHLRSLNLGITYLLVPHELTLQQAVQKMGEYEMVGRVGGRLIVRMRNVYYNTKGTLGLPTHCGIFDPATRFVKVEEK